jgi:hypothetical protein
MLAIPKRHEKSEFVNRFPQLTQRDQFENEMENSTVGGFDSVCLVIGFSRGDRFLPLL